MLNPEIEKIDHEVQTSLEYVSPEKRGELAEELRLLREDKSLLEGKVRGYLTLSDICHEYKEDLSKLRKEYSQLLAKANSHSSLGTSLQHPRSESPTPDNNHGPVKGQENEQRTHTHDPKNHHSFASSSQNNIGSVASNILNERDLPVRTKELFDLVEDPPKSSEGTKCMPHSVESTLPYRDKFPMQESIAEESNNSVTGLGFEHVPLDGMILGQSARNIPRQHSGDLMNFSFPHGPQTQSSRKQIPVANDDQDIENILRSVHLESTSDRSELRRVIDAVQSYSHTEHQKLQRTNQLLVDKTNEQKKAIRLSEDDNKRLVEKIRTLEQQLYDVSMSRSMTPKVSPHASGWVHVEKLSQTSFLMESIATREREEAMLNLNALPKGNSGPFTPEANALLPGMLLELRNIFCILHYPKEKINTLLEALLGVKINKCIKKEKERFNGPVTKATDAQQGVPSNNEDFEMLRQKNIQLTEANQRWSNEWNKIRGHYDNRIADLQSERDRISKELTDCKIYEESRERDYEKMLMNSKKKAGDEENAKEEALLQLTTANNKVESLNIHVADGDDTISALRREKQVLETELSIIRQRPVTSSAGAPPTQRMGKPQMELQTENDVLRQQLLVFQEDFDRERQDRAKAQSVKDEYKKQNEQYKKRVRHLEQKNINIDRQLKSSEDSSNRLQDEKSTLLQENASLKTQLQREIEKSRNYIASQLAYQPVVQSAGIQSQRHIIFGQHVQPRPQQFVVAPTYDQRLPHITNGMAGYMTAPGAQYQQACPQDVVNPPAPYYHSNQAGKRTEFKVGSWSCAQCTYVNYPGRTVCELCGYIQSPSTNQNNLTYRPTGNETLHARGEPQQQPPPPQPQYGYAVQQTPRDVTTDDRNYQ